MQIAFNRCVKNGGEVKRATGPDAEFGLKEGEYRDYCWKEGMKKPALGNKKNVKSKLSFLINKLKAIIGGVALAATVGGVYLETGGGFTQLDTGLVTNARYEEIKSTLVSEYLTGKLSNIELFYGDWETMKEYRAAINHEGRKGTFKDLQNITQDNLLPEIIKKLKTE